MNTMMLTCFAFVAMFIAVLANASADVRTVVLTADQEVALAYATEEANVRQAGQTDADGKPFPALTADDVLMQIITADLRNVLRNLDAQVSADQIELLKKLSPASQDEILANIQSSAVKGRLMQWLTQ